MNSDLTINKLIDCMRPDNKNDYILGYLDTKKYKDSYSLVDDNTLIGIEVEVERINTTNNVSAVDLLTNLWKSVEDGSLRNSGREFVSIPLKGKSVPFAIQILSKFLNNTNACIGHEFSERTSVHIHMNVQDMTVGELMSLIYTYLIVEPLLYNFVGNDRVNSIFCIPITQSCLTRELKKAIKFLEDGDVANCLHELSGWMKYTGFNLSPINKFGTVEFRHMYGTIDEPTLVNWINLILSIKKFALRNNHKELLNRIFLMNTNSEYTYFIQEIFGELSSLFNVDLQDTIEPCVVFLKDLHYNRDIKSLLKNQEEYIKNPFGSNLMQQLLRLGWLQRVDVEKEIKDLEYTIQLEEKYLQESDIKAIKYISLIKDMSLSLSDRLVYKEQLRQCKYLFEKTTNKIAILKHKLNNLKQGKVEEQKETPFYDRVSNRTILPSRVPEIDFASFTSRYITGTIEVNQAEEQEVDF